MTCHDVISYYVAKSPEMVYTCVNGARAVHGDEARREAGAHAKEGHHLHRQRHRHHKKLASLSHHPCEPEDEADPVPEDEPRRDAARLQPLVQAVALALHSGPINGPRPRDATELRERVEEDE